MYVHVLPASPPPPATYSQSRIFFVNNFLNLIVAIFRGLWFNTLMNIEGHRILISPNDKATTRTKNRIREHGAKGFMLERRNDNAFPPMWLVRASDGWMGWLPKEEFHLEAWGEEFFVEKF